ncbi:hypothetical protein AVEN_192410-1 [Araneus ventricosus]|uniref:Protein kinase domain-containing protein n=1 Tax=Araneus ventricosus TaxID=182803 RepID=A0A4Y1ZQA1_ARAVE|nr:hypothetical protein AVEN_192410-1 [Araneus ventricosus]
MRARDIFADEMATFQEALISVEVNLPISSSTRKQKTAKKIAEGSYGEIYKFEHIDGTERVFKCIPIDGQHAMNSYENISLSVAVPDIVASKYANSIYLASNFPVAICKEQKYIYM